LLKQLLLFKPEEKPKFGSRINRVCTIPLVNENVYKKLRANPKVEAGFFNLKEKA
jgi:hypothetical protein